MHNSGGFDALTERYIHVDDMVSATVFLTKHMNQLHKLAEKYPDEVKILKEARENDGMMLAHLPKKFCHVSFGERQKKEMTEEQKAAAAERMKKMQEARKAKLEAERIEKENLEEGWL